MNALWNAPISDRFSSLCARVFSPAAAILESEKTLGTRLTLYGREFTGNERDFLLLLSKLVSGFLDPSFSRQSKNKMSNFFLPDRKGSLANSRKRQVNASKVSLQVLTEMWY